MPANSIKINGDWEFTVGDSQMEGLLSHLWAICSEESGGNPNLGVQGDMQKDPGLMPQGEAGS